MSNSCPTMDECLEAVNYLNVKYDGIQSATPRLIPAYFIIAKVIANYDLIEISVLGNIVWDSFSDSRTMITESYPEYEEGNPKPILLLEHLISEMLGIALGIDRVLSDIVGLKSPFEDVTEEVKYEEVVPCKKNLH